MREKINRLSFSELQTRAMVGLCAVPSLCYNVAPHVNDWIAGGIMAIGPAGTAIMQLVAVMMLSGLSISIARAHWVSKITFSLFGVAIILLNFMNILDATYAVRGNSTHAVRATIASAEAAKARIAQLEKARSEIPAFHATSEELVAAARSAVASAERARDLECASGVGEQCRKLGQNASTVQSSLMALAAQRTITVQAEKIDADLAQWRSKLAALGPLPQAVDETSAAVGELAGLSESTVIKWRPRFMALMAELFCLFGPSVMRMWMMPAIVTEKNEDFGTVRHTVRATILPAVKLARKPLVPEVRQLPAPDLARRIPKKVGPSPEDLASIQDWHAERVATRRGKGIQAADCYANYQAWCEERGIYPATFNRFGRTIRGELKIDAETKSGRVFYQGIAFKGTPLRVVARA
jgi:hypothetical protein